MHSARWRLAQQFVFGGADEAGTVGVLSSGEHQQGHLVEGEPERAAAGQARRILERKALAAVRAVEITHTVRHLCRAPRRLRRRSCSLGIRVDDAAQRRHVGVVATPPDDDVALVDHLVVGGIKTQPLELAGRLWRPHRGPGMRGVDTDHAILSRRWVGGQVAGHVAGRQPIGAQAGDRQSREVLHTPLPGRQNLIDAGRHRGRPRAIGEVGVNPRDVRSRSTATNGRSGTKLGAAYSRTSSVISGGFRSRANSVAKAPRAPTGRACSQGATCRSGTPTLRRRRVHLDDRLAGDGQRLMRFGDMEIRADVAVGVQAR